MKFGLCKFSIHETVLCVLVLLAPIAPVLVPQTASAQIPGLQTDAPEPASDPLAPAEIAKRLRDVESERSAANHALETATDPGAKTHALAQIEALREISGLLAEQSRLASPDASTLATRDDSASAVPSVFLLNALLERRFESEAAGIRTGELVAARREALDAAKERLKSAKQALREAQSTSAAPSGADPASDVERLTLLRRVAEERVHLLTLEVDQGITERDAAGNTQQLERDIEHLREELSEGKGQPANGLAAVAQRGTVLERSRADLARSASTLDLQLQLAQRRYAEQHPSSEGLEEIEALKAAHDALRRHTELIDVRLERLAKERALWDRWDASLTGSANRDQVAAWEQETGEWAGKLEQAALEGPGHVVDLRRRLQAAEERRVASESAPVRLAFDKHQESLTALLAARLADNEDIEAERRFAERVLRELAGRSNHLEPGEWVELTVTAARDMWGYEITTVDDSPITVGSLVVALLLFSAGFWVARRGSMVFGRVATQRLKLDLGATHALETLAFYALLVSFTLLALRAVHFPLTAFTVLGGALAIGIGFGSQNVMNNFISGLILMLERPIRARDVVEVEGNHGTVEHIGARSTRIRSVDGRHIIVPNSFFLETNVVNWTLSDELLRAKVTVGVVYGSPTRLVEELIQRVVDEEPGVHKRPAPIIIFEEFGDNSLNFDVHFWVTARSPMDTRRVASRIRFRIDDLFREHDLVIAFPQRDIHLDTVAPIEIKFVEGNSPGSQR